MSKIVKTNVEDWTGRVLKSFEGAECEDQAIEWYFNHEDMEDLTVVGIDEEGNEKGVNFG